MKVCIVGSGPAGVSAAVALLKNGHEVLMLDYGNDISEKGISAIKNLAENDKKQWSESMIDAIKYPIHKKMENKLAFGENYPYRDGLKLLNIHLKNCGFYPSLATGGLSNVWGAAVMPYIEKDIKDWPISIKDLTPYYEEINSILNISLCGDDFIHDDLIDEYPYFNNLNDSNKRKISGQLKHFRSLLKENQDFLNSKGIKPGFSRNALNAGLCVECGLCMWGCPLDLIYNSKHTLTNLKSNPLFKYLDGKLVKSFSESGEEKVNVLAIDKHSSKEEKFEVNKLFLACGVLPTAKIVLKSLKHYSPIKIKQSTHFLFPLVNFDIKGEYVNQKKSATLSEMFIEINNDDVSANTIHLQVYPYNDMMLDALKNKLGMLYKPFSSIIHYLLNKTIIIQGFIHSNDSENIHIELSKNDTLTVTGEKQNQNQRIKKIIQFFKNYGLVPTYEISIPGRSFHCGGSFPMTSNGKSSLNSISTNTMGLLQNTNNVHIVDASIFPSIPAQTITYTVMANAYRIGSLVK